MDEEPRHKKQCFIYILWHRYIVLFSSIDNSKNFCYAPRSIMFNSFHGVLVHLHDLLYTKGNNFCYFLFASLDNETLSKCSVFLKGCSCSQGSKVFSLGVNYHGEEMQNRKWQELFPLKVYLFTFKIWFKICQETERQRANIYEQTI